MKSIRLSLALVGAIALAASVEAGVISVNFLSTVTNSVNETLLPATEAGVWFENNWNNVVTSDSLTDNATGTMGALKDNAGVPTAAEVTWASANTWYDSNAQADADVGVGDAQVALGYLDDQPWVENVSSNGAQVTVTGIPYASYSVALLLSTDAAGGIYQPGLINGVTNSTTGDKIRYASPGNWQAYNTMVASNLSGTLTIILPPKSGINRASIAGIQIAESSEGPPVLQPVAPDWLVNPITGASASIDTPYTDTLDGLAVDRNGDEITYSKTSGPEWLDVDPDGTYHGTPSASDSGSNSFVVAASDGINTPSEATLNIVVSASYEGLVLIDNTVNNGSFEDPGTGWDEISSGTFPFWENWSEMESNNTSTGGGNPGSNGTYLGVDGWFMVYIGPGGAIVNMTEHVIEVGDVIDFSMFNVRDFAPWSGPADISLVWDDGGTKAQIPGTEVSVDVHVQGGGQFTVQEGDPWVGSTLGIGVRHPGTGDTWPELDQFFLGIATGAPGEPVTVMITGPVSGGTEMQLSWMNQDGKNYTVETNSNLIIGNWQPMNSGVNGVGETITITAPITGNELFYRVITE